MKLPRQALPMPPECSGAIRVHLRNNVALTYSQESVDFLLYLVTRVNSMVALAVVEASVTAKVPRQLEPIERFVCVMWCMWRNVGSG